jgi:TctA family transporter
MLMSDQNWAIYVNRPICLFLLLSIVLLLALPFVRGIAQFAGRKPAEQRG